MHRKTSSLMIDRIAAGRHMLWRTASAALLALLAVLLLLLLALSAATPRPVAAQAFAQPLPAGWSLVAVNQGGLVEEVFGGGFTEAVFGWDAGAQAFESWQRSLPGALNSLQVIADGQAVWVLTSADDSFVQFAFQGVQEALLAAGWTLLGWTAVSLPTVEAGEILGAGTIINWDSAQQAFGRWDAAAPSFVEQLNEVRGGDGIWVFREEAGVATIAPLPGPIDDAPVLESASFDAADGVTLAADLWRGFSTWYLFAHQNGRDRTAWADLPRVAAEQFGFSVLAWDFRGFGASDPGALGDIVMDWQAAIDFAVSQGATTIHAIGASMGGTSLMVQAAGDARISSLVLISAPALFAGIDALAAAPGVLQDTNFFAGDADGNAAADAQAMAAALGGKKGIRILPTALHGNDLAASDLITDAEILFPPP